MTIYHVGTEDIHFVPGGHPAVWPSPILVLTLPAYRTDFSRCALVGEPGKFWRAPLQAHPITSDSFWFTCRMAQITTFLGVGQWISFLSDDVARLSVKGRAGQLPELLRHNDDETTTTLATGILPMFAQFMLGRVDIYVDIGSGTFKLFLDHALSISFTGDLTNGEWTDITGYDLTAGGFQVSSYFSEVCWRSDDTRKIVGVRAIWPYGDGHTQDWTGVKADVDEVEVDELDANYTDTPDLLQQYTVPPLPSGLTQNTIVGAVMLGARMATNPTDEAVNIRTGGSDFNSTSFDTGNAIEDRMYIWETNPDTTDPFTIDEVNDSEFNIGVAST